jgi:hypothetical protein
MRNLLPQTAENEGFERRKTPQGVMYPFRRNRLFNALRPSAALAERQVLDSKTARIGLAEIRQPVRTILDGKSLR